MNWTGGRLRRHCNQGTAQQSNRKQKFQKSKWRFKARASPPELSLFTANTQQDLRHKETQEEEDTNKCSPKPDPTPIAPPCSTTLLSTKTPTHTDRLKQQLLQKSDWAAVSAARPLQMSFSPVEETERFGKRRRLTDSDRKRLNSYQWPRPEQTQIAWKSGQGDDDLSEVGTADKLDIRINGQRPNAGRMGSQIADKRLASSQPMLLDSEPLNMPPRDDRNEQLREDRLLSPFPDPESIRFDSPSLNSTSKGGTSPPIEEQVAPPRRHFTIDDQLVAEKQGILNIPHHPPTEEIYPVDNYQYSPPHKKEAIRLDQATGDTQSSSGNHWLPNPRCTIQRVLRPKLPRPTLSTPSTARSTLYDSTLQINPTTTTTTQQVSPPKIYGQPVISLDQVTARNASSQPWILSSPDLDPQARRQHNTTKDYPSLSIPSTETLPRTSSPQPANRLDPFFSSRDIPPSRPLPDLLHTLPRTTIITTTDNANSYPWMLGWPIRRQVSNGYIDK